MIQSKDSRDERTNRRTVRSKASVKTQARVKKTPTKAVLKQMAKDWEHVT